MLATAMVDGSRPPDAWGTDAPVPWWSFTKTVLSIAALRLVEQGVLALDGRVDTHPFTLRRLLRHEAGGPDYGAMVPYYRAVAAGEAPWSVPDMLAAAGAERLLFEPGTGWSYSNIGYMLVAGMVASASGRPLAAALDLLVFGPARLRTARLAMGPDDLAGVVMGPGLRYDPGWVYHGLVTGTLADAVLLLRALVSGGLLRADTLPAMLAGRPLPRHRSDAHPDPAYGLGLMASAVAPGSHPAGHTDGGPGSRIAVYAVAGRAAAAWASPASGCDVERTAMALLRR